MFHIEDVLLLKDDERVKTVTRRHIITLFPGLSVSLVLIVLPFFLLFPLFGWAILGVVIFFLSLVLGLGIAMRALLLWDSDVLVVTTLRLVDVDQRGLFTRIVSEAPLSAIQDVSWAKKGIVETLLGIGSIKIQTTNATTTVEARRISHPQRIHELINELRRHPEAVPAVPTTPAPQAPTQTAEAVKKITSMLETYSPEELVRIEAVLHARERSAAADEFLAEEQKEAKTNEQV